MKKQKYKPEELEFSDAQDEHESNKEQGRTRKIFEELKARAIKKQWLSPLEKNFFSRGVFLSHLDDGKLEDYEACDDYLFYSKILTYGHDITGGSQYMGIRRNDELNTMEKFQIPRKEVDNDLDYLKKSGFAFELEIQNHRQSDELLKYVCTEGRKELKIFEQLWINIPHNRRYDYEKLQILLKYRGIFIMVGEVIEKTPDAYFKTILNGQEIELDGHTLVHIYGRHFFEILQGVYANKTMHIIDIEHRELVEQLCKFINEIEVSGLLNGHPIDKVAFQFKGENYIIRTNLRNKSLSGQGNIQFKRIDTFFRIGERKEMDILESDYTLKKINSKLSVYVPK